MAALTQQHAQQSETYNRQASGLKLQIAELMQLLADERRKREGLDQERAKLAGQMESAARSASMSRSELEERVRALGASETSLTAQLADAAARLDKVRGCWARVAASDAPGCIPAQNNCKLSLSVLCVGSDSSCSTQSRFKTKCELSLSVLCVGKLLEFQALCISVRPCPCPCLARRARSREVAKRR